MDFSRLFFVALSLLSCQHLKEEDVWKEDDKREERKLTQVIRSVLSSRGDGSDSRRLPSHLISLLGDLKVLRPQCLSTGQIMTGL